MATQAPTTFPTAAEMADLLAEVLAGVAGGARTTWSNRIGAVERLPTWRYVRHNWRVTPRGTAAEREVIERAVEIVRAEHPYVD